MKTWPLFRREAESSARRVQRGLSQVRDRVAQKSSFNLKRGNSMGPSQKEYITAESYDQKIPRGLFYRSGYLLTDAALSETRFRETFPFLPNWKVRSMGNLTFAHDPEGPIAEAEADGDRVLIFGDAFDCFEPTRKLPEIVVDLLQGRQEDRRLFGTLDRLGGRFVCLVSSGGDVRVFNDAIGGRSLYVSCSPYRTVASHSFLISRLHQKTLVEGTLLFLTSRAYARRDVKYLPGITTAFEDIYLCPPNNSFSFAQGTIRRYWPREELQAVTDQEALDVLVSVLEGTASYYARAYQSQLFGLTSGYDSRPMFAALVAHGGAGRIDTYTLFRNEAQSGSKKDVEVARRLSQLAGVHHETIDMTVKQTHRELFSQTMLEMSRATGYFRVGAPYATVRLFKQFGTGEQRSYLRGFGGEILRGFYQATSKKITAPTARQFARAYGVAEGSAYSLGLFRQMLEFVDYRATFNVDINDLFYWEHRMAAWASTVLMETDPIALTAPVYNCRRLYEIFLALPFESRASGWHFKAAMRHFRPDFPDD